MARGAAAVQAPVAGSYCSVVVNEAVPAPLVPPTTRTLPDGKTVVVVRSRAVASAAVGVQAFVERFD